MSQITKPIMLDETGQALVEAIENIAVVAGNKVSVSATGTATDEISYITVDNVEKKIAGGSGVSSFNDLTNRPQYNGATMTGSTSIPEVKTATWDGKSTVSVSASGSATEEISYITIDGVEKKINGGTATAGVSTFNGRSGAVVPASGDYTASMVGALPDSTVIPTKTSDLTNDSGFLTEHQSLANYSTTSEMNTAIANHHDSTKANTADLADVATSGDYDDLSNKPTIPVVPTNVSAFTNDAGYLTSHQSLADYRKAADQDVIDATKINEPTDEGTSGQVLSTDGEGGRTWVSQPVVPSVIDGLNSSSTTDALSANQGRVLNGGLSSLGETVSDIDDKIGSDCSDDNPAIDKQYVDDAIDVVEAMVPTVENNVTSTSTTNALSAAQGKALQDQITNLQNIGRFLAILDCSNGTVSSQPNGSVGDSYAYKVGDYYRVGVGGNYGPKAATTFTIDSTSGSTNFETGATTYSVGDVIYCSNLTSSTSTWVRQSSSGGGTVQDVQIDSVSVLSGGIANIPQSSASSFGVIKIGPRVSGTSYSNGVFTYVAEV